MPNTKSAIKAMHQSKRRYKRNVKTKDKFKSAVKEVRKLIAAGNKKEAAEAIKKAMSALDKAVKTNVIHKNKSSRLKSRMAKGLAKIRS
jgi:small subunit ribosomal protein S20